MQSTAPHDPREPIRMFLGDRFEAEVESKGAKDAFRELFCNMLGFSYANEDLLATHSYDFRDSLSASLQEAVIIADTDNPDRFSIIYTKCEKTTKTLRQDLVRDLIRITGSIDLPFANFLLVLESKGRWQVISPLYNRELDRSQLRMHSIEEGAKYRTLAEALSKLKLEKSHPPALEIKGILDEAMYVLPLTKEFFKDYKDIHKRLVEEVRGSYASALEVGFSSYEGGVPKEILINRAAKGFAHVLLNRLMFIYFLQKKGWLGRVDLIKWLAEEHAKKGGELYKDYLRPLLLDVMCKPRHERSLEGLPQDVRELFEDIPYFNGGLFSPFVEEGVDVDSIVVSLDDELLRETIHGFLEEYNFTITEESPYEVEVAVDPAMLGHIYESLIAEQERPASGIFYTPRAEVDLMCRLGIISYLKSKTSMADDEVVSFVVSPEVAEHGLEHGMDELKRVLSEVRVVDPACGSGAFLLGMLHVLTELYEALGVEVSGALKRKLIRSNIYGVDIKEWAVRVAELRLWLALVEGEGEPPEEEPVLPNLHTNIRVGDSVAPPVVGRRAVQLRADMRRKMRSSLRDPQMKALLDEFVEEKERVFSGNGRADVLERGLAELKSKLLLKLLSPERGALMEQGVLSSGVGGRAHTKSSPEMQMLGEVLAALESGDGGLELPFIWEVDFAEVFSKGDFDIVVSNPPYVRQEQIYPQWLDRDEFEQLPSERQKELKEVYKQSLIDSSQDVIRLILGEGGSLKLSKKSDMYVYFFIHSTYLLREGGTLVYITSNSWLDVGYGEGLQEFILKCGSLRCVVDSAYRSFEHADVNTVITAFERKRTPATVDEHLVAFALVRVPFGLEEKSSLGEDGVRLLLKPSEETQEVNLSGVKVRTCSSEKARVRYVSERGLVKLGKGDVEGHKSPYSLKSYKGAKWGGLLIRAPEIFYTVLEKGKDKLVPLGEVAEVRRGFTTGANEFFYVEDLTERITDAELERVVNRRDVESLEEARERGLRVVKSTYKQKVRGKEVRCEVLHLLEGEYLKPVIKSPRELKSIVVKEADLKYKVLMCHETKSGLKGSFLLDYIKWGEARGYQKRPTCASRGRWWDVGEWIAPDGILPCGFGEAFKFFVNEQKILADKRMYNLYSEKYNEILSFMNSSLYPMLLEIGTRTGLGEGLLDLTVYEFEDSLVLKEGLNGLTLPSRPIHSIFTELGFDRSRPIREQQPEPLPDRKALDDVVFDALGLTEEERRKVYWAVAELVKSRLDKAKTFDT